MALDGPRLPASGGTAKSLVIFLHGYGADGDDLIGLGREWQSTLPDTEFVSPHAPEPCAQNPAGKQWWDLQVRSDAERWAGLNRSGPLLDTFISAEMERAGLKPDKVALVGFSQGTMMALHVGLRRAEALAGIIGYSGVLAGAERLKDEIKTRPPVLLAHGTMDQVIPVDALVSSVEALAENNVPRSWHVAHGMAHGIDRAGLSLGVQFLQKVLG